MTKPSNEMGMNMSVGEKKWRWKHTKNCLTQGTSGQGAHGGHFHNRDIVNKMAECERRFGTTQNGRVPLTTRCREEGSTFLVTSATLREMRY
jgi:hypothetical protein